MDNMHGIVELLGERTWTEFRVDATTLDTHTTAKVWVSCSNCGEQFQREYRQLAQLHSCRGVTYCLTDPELLAIECYYTVINCDYLCSLTAEDLMQQWVVQQGLCFYSSEPLRLAPQSARLQLLNHKLGYSKNNVVWTKEGGPGCSIPSQPRVSTRLEYQLISPLARPLYQKRSTDAGHDIYSIVDAVVAPHSICSIATGIKVVCPDGFYLTVEGRSSMLIGGVAPIRGIIDSGYTGELIVVLFNHSNIPYEVETGDRIAQIIVHRMTSVDLVAVSEFSPEYSHRAEAGFGSSGKK